MFFLRLADADLLTGMAPLGLSFLFLTRMGCRCTKLHSQIHWQKVAIEPSSGK